MPVAAPVAAPFPLARAVSDGTAPAAPPAIPPAAPQRPMDELESLAAQPSNRRRFARKTQARLYQGNNVRRHCGRRGHRAGDHLYCRPGPSKTGLGGIGGDDTNNPPNVAAPKPAIEKPKPEKEKKDAAVAAAKPKDADCGRRPNRLTSRKTPVVSDDSDFQIKTPANPAPQQPNRKDISPPELGGPDDPVMGKRDE